jgi:hypothetical protein
MGKPYAGRERELFWTQLGGLGTGGLRIAEEKVVKKK